MFCLSVELEFVVNLKVIVKYLAELTVLLNCGCDKAVNIAACYL